MRPSILFFALLCAGSFCVPQARHGTAHITLPPEQRIDINHAAVAQLVKAPGITRVWAERIVRFRPYRAKNELVDRGVLPGDVYQRAKDCIIAHRDK